MTPELTSQAWAQIRYDYEHTDRPVEDICAEHGISSGTLRDRLRRWGWTRRRVPIPLEGPPPAPAPPLDFAAPALAASPEIETAASWDMRAPPAATGGDAGDAGAADDRPIAERLQGAVARVLPAIEGTLARLGATAAHPRELERSARALAALTRTLRELSGLLAQHRTAPACNCGGPMNSGRVEELRQELARKLEAFVASTEAADGGAGPEKKDDDDEK